MKMLRYSAGSVLIVAALLLGVLGAALLLLAGVLSEWHDKLTK